MHDSAAKSRTTTLPAQSSTLRRALSGGAPVQRRWLYGLLSAATAYLLISIGLLLWWCNQPPMFDVAERVARVTPPGQTPVTGTAVVATAIGIGSTLLDKPGGFLYNDRLPPGLFLDNCPSWECGVLMALRDLVQALRNDFTRAQSQSVEHLDLRRADLKLANDPDSWLFPAAEAEYRQALVALDRYLDQLARDALTVGRFQARADNLSAYLALVEKRLGNFSLRLSGTTTQPVPGSGDPGSGGRMTATRGAGVHAGEVAQLVEETPSNEIDNVFHCARGYSWALLHLIRAIEHDFTAVLADKGAVITLQQVTRDLQGAIKPLTSPFLLTGQGYGLLANHPLVLAASVSRTNAGIIDLRLLLEQG
ncbi:DUF2333 family protein [Thiohalocapsa marina]|uniref:DUF2333 family protein n=2 Tax=Thiohalocapsa marina TaxID=424902 RepID=A0A5M8FAU4_9GAMM|nr:DUF2333 family protein [Thiohalocapsa marina]